MATNKGGCLGLLVGTAAATYATVSFGYDIGTAVNDYFEIQNSVGRGVVNLTAMGMIATPVFFVGTYGGTFLGLIGNAIARPFVNAGEDITKKVTGSERRQQRWVEIADEEDSLGTY